MSSHNEHHPRSALYRVLNHPTVVIGVIVVALVALVERFQLWDALLKRLDLSKETNDLRMLLVGALLFLVLWQLLDRYLFGPYLKLLEAREAATSGAESSAVEVTAKADVVTAEYERRLTEARVTAMKGKLEKTGVAKQKAAAIAEKAEGEAQEHLRNVRWEINNKISTLRSSSLAEADGMADLIIQKIRSGAGAS